jgi:Rib/alpha/Esp surface antigen-like repeat protein
MAVGAILIAKFDEALPLAGMWSGFGSKPDTVTPGGKLRAVNVTSPVYPTSEVPVTVRGTDVTCAEDTEEEETLRA